MRCDLVPDRRGMMWDLLLYIPTVFFLALLSTKFWYGDDKNFSYLLAFLASFFFLAGSNRILKTRLMAVGSAPVAIDAGKDAVRVMLRSGKSVDLLKKIRRYGDYAGKSFGLSGLDGTGRLQQFVFHKAQFAEPSEYERIQKEIEKLRETREG